MLHSTVSNIIRQYGSDKSDGWNAKIGPKFKLTYRSLRNFFDPLYVIIAKFSSTADMNISESTGRVYIKNFHLIYYVTVQKPFKTPTHIGERMQRARVHGNWKDAEWSQIMFTNEYTAVQERCGS